MLYLSPEVKSGLGEDTFWTWAEREFPNVTFNPPSQASAQDVVLRYATLGPVEGPAKTIALLWELYPEMAAYVNDNRPEVIQRMNACGRQAVKRVVSSALMVPYYQHLGPIDILPIGVNTELFRPRRDEKQALRQKYGIPQDKRVGFWSGTTHTMKGSDRLVKYAQDNPDVFWITCWKQPGESGHLPGAYETVLVSQQQLSDLMNCADFFLSTSRLRPFFMVEWEAMACDVPFVDISGLERDFVPSEHPREDILARGWDRKTARKTWLEYINEA